VPLIDGRQHLRDPLGRILGGRLRGFGDVIPQIVEIMIGEIGAVDDGLHQLTSCVDDYLHVPSATRALTVSATCFLHSRDVGKLIVQMRQHISEPVARPVIIQLVTSPTAFATCEVGDT